MRKRKHKRKKKIIMNNCEKIRISTSHIDEWRRKLMLVRTFVRSWNVRWKIKRKLIGNFSEKNTFLKWLIQAYQKLLWLDSSIVRSLGWFRLIRYTLEKKIQLKAKKASQNFSDYINRYLPCLQNALKSSGCINLENILDCLKLDVFSFIFSSKNLRLFSCRGDNFAWKWNVKFR